MSQTAPKDQTKPLTREEAVARLRRIRAALAEATKDLTDEELEALIERITRRVKAGLAEHVRKGRGETH